MVEALTFNVGTAVQNYLLGQSLVTDIVGTNIWKNYLPQGKSVPAIVIVVDEGIPLKDFSGTNPLHNSNAGLWAYGNDDDQAVLLDGTIRGVLDDLDKTVGDRVAVQDSSDANDPPDDGGIDYRFNRKTDYLVHSYRS